MTKLVFYTDFERDLKIYKKWKLRKFFGEKTFNHILSETYPELVGKTDREILNYFRKNKKGLLSETKKYGFQLQRKFESDKFFEEIDKITGFSWKNKVYYCHLSSTFICGGCYDAANKGNIVSVFPKSNDSLYVLFHELVHLHFWETLDRLKIQNNKKERLIAKGKFWNLSEIAVNYPLQKLKFKGYRPEFGLYPQHKGLWNRIKKYQNLDFKQFILKSINEL